MDESNTEGHLIHLDLPFSKSIAIGSSSLIASALVLPSLIPILPPLKANHLPGCNNNGKRRSLAAISYLMRRVSLLALSAILRIESHSNCPCNPYMNQERITRIIDCNTLETSISTRSKRNINEKIFSSYCDYLRQL